MAGLVLLSVTLLLDATAVFSHPHSRSSIVGGHNAKKGDWPWIAAIVFNDNPKTIRCGGTLVNDTWVLTAAHCFDKFDKSHFSVRLGVYRLTENVTDEKVFKIVKSFIPENYTNVVNGDDIALLQLDRPVRIPGVEPYPIDHLGDSKDIYEGPCRVAGWGRVTENDPLPESEPLQEVAVPLISNGTCKNTYPEVTDDMICTGNSSKGFCCGDSGGPLMCFPKNGSRKGQKLAGIVSYGVRCGQAEYPGVYTRVSSYRDFIRDTIKGSRMENPEV